MAPDLLLIIYFIQYIESGGAEAFSSMHWESRLGTPKTGRQSIAGLTHNRWTKHPQLWVI